MTIKDLESLGFKKEIIDDRELDGFYNEYYVLDIFDGWSLESDYDMNHNIRVSVTDFEHAVCFTDLDKLKEHIIHMKTLKGMH
jgi:hypothetical protein